MRRPFFWIRADLSGRGSQGDPWGGTDRFFGLDHPIHRDANPGVEMD